MFYMISKSLGGLSDPATLLAIALLAAAAAALAGWRRTAAWLGGAAVAIVVLLGVLPGANFLALPLEERFAADPALPDHVAGIVALGGTERVAQSTAWKQPTLSDPGPIAALLALGRRYPDAKLVFTGGGRAAPDSPVSEATVVHDFIKEIGQDAERVIYEDHSRNTLENAVLTRALVRPQPGERWVLVCQAISMPRAVAVFRHAGWDVIPFPAGYLTVGTSGRLLTFDLLGGLSLASLAIHEWIGLLAYRVMGYTDDIFPQ